MSAPIGWLKLRMADFGLKAGTWTGLLVLMAKNGSLNLILILDSPTTNTALVTSTGQILLGTDQGLFQYDPVLNSITDLQLGQVDVKLIYETTDQRGYGT